MVEVSSYQHDNGGSAMATLPRRDKEKQRKEQRKGAKKREEKKRGRS